LYADPDFKLKCRIEQDRPCQRARSDRQFKDVLFELVVQRHTMARACGVDGVRRWHVQQEVTARIQKHEAAITFHHGADTVTEAHLPAMLGARLCIL
jgi:hypothetical protein